VYKIGTYSFAKAFSDIIGIPYIPYFVKFGPFKIKICEKRRHLCDPIGQFLFYLKMEG